MLTTKKKRIIIWSCIIIVLIAILGGYFYIKKLEKNGLAAYENKDYKICYDNLKKNLIFNFFAKSNVLKTAGICAYNTGNFADAIKDYQKSLKKDDTYSTRLLLGNAYRDQGDNNLAIENYTQLINNNPNYKYQPVYINLMTVYLTEDDTQKAIDLGNKFLNNPINYNDISNDNISADILFLLRSAYQKNGDTVKANEIAQRLIKYNPSLSVIMEKQ